MKLEREGKDTWLSYLILLPKDLLQLADFFKETSLKRLTYFSTNEPNGKNLNWDLFIRETIIHAYTIYGYN